MVSHDREFLKGLVTKTVEFGQRVKTLLGGIEYYLEQRKLKDMRVAEAKSAAIKKRKQVAKIKSLVTKRAKQLEKGLEKFNAKIRAY